MLTARSGAGDVVEIEHIVQFDSAGRVVGVVQPPSQIARLDGQLAQASGMGEARRQFSGVRFLVPRECVQKSSRGGCDHRSQRRRFTDRP
jgi:hypothetical protein